MQSIINKEITRNKSTVNKYVLCLSASFKSHSDQQYLDLHRIQATHIPTPKGPWPRCTRQCPAQQISTTFTKLPPTWGLCKCFLFRGRVLCSSCQSSNDHQYCQHNEGYLLWFQTRLLYRVVKSTLPPWCYWWCHCYTAQLFGLPTTGRIRYCLLEFILILLSKTAESTYFPSKIYTWFLSTWRIQSGWREKKIALPSGSLSPKSHTCVCVCVCVFCLRFLCHAKIRDFWFVIYNTNYHESTVQSLFFS